MVQTDDQFMLKDPQGANKFIAYDEPVSTFDARYGFYNPTYGEIYATDIDVGVVMAAQDTWYQVTAWSNSITSFAFDGHNGEFANTTPDASNDHITILETGIYMVHWWGSAYSSQVNKFKVQVRRNNGAKGFPNTSGFRTTSTAGAIGHVAGGGLCEFNINDTIELWAQRLDGAGVSKTVTIRQATLSLHLVH